VHHPRRVERVKAFAAVLQDHKFRPIVDAGNRGTITVATRPETSEATVSTNFIHDVLGNSYRRRRQIAWRGNLTNKSRFRGIPALAAGQRLTMYDNQLGAVSVPFGNSISRPRLDRMRFTLMTRLQLARPEEKPRLAAAGRSCTFDGGGLIAIIGAAGSTLAKGAQ
jgi:hypothetical protein